MTYTPGTIVSARDREWIVQPKEDDLPESVLRLRPLTGTSEDEFLLDCELESDVAPASFPPPDADKAGTFSQALLLRDALRLSLRAGAGPFRSFGDLTFAPRAYQLVPLMMALKQPGSSCFTHSIRWSLKYCRAHLSNSCQRASVI